MFWDILGVSIAIISIGGTIALLMIAVALLRLSDARLEWVRLRREMFESSAKEIVKSSFRRRYKK